MNDNYGKCFTQLTNFMMNLFNCYGRKWPHIPILITMLLICQLNQTYAQTTVTGIVTNQAGDPIPQVNVSVRGTSISTQSDDEGYFTILDVADGLVLVFSHIGYMRKEVPLSGESELTVILEEDAAALDEVVVVGYGTRSRASLTGSIATVSTETLKANPVGSVTQALQGTVPGMTVTTSNQPGGGANIRIRGMGTINNNDPLWVIDGVPRTGGFNLFNPSDIESITVLKDAISTAIYGARGANGVILVTTVTGRKSQPPRINFNVRYGATRNTARYDLLDSEEYGEMLWLQARNSGVDPTHPIYGSGETPRIPRYILPAGVDNVDLSLYDIWTFPITETNLNGTDWHAEIFNNAAVTKEYNLAVSGGSENTTYSFNMGVLDEDGIVKMTGFQRYTLGVNVSSTIKPWLELGQNTQLSYLNDFGHQSAGENGAMAIIPQLTPLMPVRDIMGNYAPLSRLTGFDPLNNPVADIERGQNHTRESVAINGNVFGILSFTDNLKFKTLLGYYNTQRRHKAPLEANPDSYQARSEHQLTEESLVSRQLNWTNTLNYSALFGEYHKVEMLLGTESIDFRAEDIGATRMGFLLTNDDYWVLNAGSGAQTNSGSANDWSLFSYFARLHYSFNDTYLFDAVFRRDGSSRFSESNRYGNFPALGFGWLASEERYLQSAKNWLSHLKLRVSWGLSGNDQIGNYNAFSTYRTHNWYSNYPIDGSNNSLTTGFVPLALGNPDAKWETTSTVNIGLEAQLFDRFALDIDLWQRNTKDMLYPRAVPGVYGMANIPSVNIGNMKNRGIDLQVSYKGETNNTDLNYNISLNLSHYRNEITRLSDREDEAIIGSAYRDHIYVRSENGTSFPQFYGYEVDGIFQSDEEAAMHAPAFGTYNAAGRFKYRDVNGDGIINESDRTYIGSPHPDFTGGVVASVRYKNFNLETSFYASVGNDIVNVARRYTDFNMFQRNRSTRRLYESWGSPYLSDNSAATMPIAELNDANSQLPSSYFVEDGSFLRLQQLQLGYRIPANLLNKISVQSLRLYAMATNLFTITKYSGLDPQISTGDRAFGVDLGVWPTPQRFLFGIEISL